MSAVAEPMVVTPVEKLLKVVEAAKGNYSLWMAVHRQAAAKNAHVTIGSILSGKELSDRVSITTPHGKLVLTIDRDKYIRISSSTDKSVVTCVLKLLTQAGIISLPAVVKIETLKLIFNALLT